MSNAIEVRNCELYKEYVTRHGKKIQIMGKGPSKVRVLILATKSELDIPGNYKVFIPEEDTYDSMEEETVVVMAKDVINKIKKQVNEEDECCIIEDKKIDIKESGTSVYKKGTIKQLVWDMLRKEVCTRTDLAKAAIAKDLTENKDIKGVKKYISVVLDKLKKDEGVKLITIKPGTYKIED